MTGTAEEQLPVVMSAPDGVPVVLSGPESVPAVFAQLCSPLRLERDRGLEALRSLLPTLPPAEADRLLAEADSTLDELDAVWHRQLGALTCVAALLEGREHPLPDGVLSHLLELAPAWLGHPEARVRAAAGDLLGRLCALHSAAVLSAVLPAVSRLVLSSLEAAEEEGDRWETGSATSRDSADVFAATSSWTVLETSLRALQRLVEAARLAPSDDLLDLVLPALRHSNRFVREAGFGCVTALLPAGDAGTETSGGAPAVDSVVGRLAAAVAGGMDDNWSQVRMAASVAARRLLCGLTPESRRPYLPLLLPRVCLSRYYVAEGVKLYNQRTWELMAGTRGRELVQEFLPDVVEYYLTASEAENHAVREAACYCVAELTRKLPSEPLAAHADRLLAALLVCFQDDSWPVRDTAGLAVGQLMVAFPETCRPHLERIYPLLYGNLHDNIPSVRQGGAEALAGAVRAYGEPALSLVMERVTEDLTGVEGQRADSDPGSDRANDAALHTDRPMFSCGSLAPKMAAGGCSASHRFRRPAEPWERADGAARLLSALAAVPGCGAAVSEALPLLAAAAGRRHYVQHVQLLETVCRGLPPLAAGIGKRAFKPHLHLLLDSLMCALTSDSQLTAEAGRWCAQQLSALLGPNIFRGRVESHSPALLATLDRLLPPPPP